MVKRSIQVAKPGYSTGIEYDHLAIRAARLSTDGRGGFAVDKLEEIRGDYTDEENLVAGFRHMRSALNLAGRDNLVACLGGKQVFATELEFRRLGPEDMEQALRLELRKTVHFEVATSTLDYEFVDEEEGSTSGSCNVLVALASNALLNRQLKVLERAGMTATAVDVLPVALANAMWSWDGGSDGTHPLVALHVGPQVSTIVIDGNHSPFFNRTLHFAAEEALNANAKPADRDKRLQHLADEISRSTLFYEKNYGVSGFRELLLLGEYLDDPSLADKLQAQTGLSVRKMDLASRYGSIREPQPGRYDLAIALALRGDA